nr:MAG TPA: hypothetical protein [Caudoviricetes sp.]
MFKSLRSKPRSSQKAHLVSQVGFGGRYKTRNLFKLRISNTYMLGDIICDIKRRL